MNVVASDKAEVVLAPGERHSLSLENTSAASHYFTALDPGTTGDFPLRYAHKLVGEVPGGEQQFDGTGIARAIGYAMPGADFVTFEFQNITHMANDFILVEEEEGQYRVWFVAVSFD